MMKKIFLFTAFCAALAAVSPRASAQYEIIIDTSVSGEGEGERRFPIALPRFMKPDGGYAGGLSGKIIKLMEKDLTVTGLFDVFTDKRLPKADKDTTAIDFKKWKAAGMGALIKGVMEKMGRETVLQLRLYDVAGERMLVGKQYAVTSQNLIDATHRFVDTAMGYLTGFRGPFESKIIASCGKPFKRLLMVFEMDGARVGRYTSGKGNNISPAWAPDGRRVAFTSFETGFPEVWITDGRSNRQVTTFKSTTITPNWSPGGSSIVTASAMSGDTELYEVSLDGGVIRQVTQSANIDLAPSFSPDGRLVFSSERSGGLHLFTTDTAGNTRRLTYVGYQNDQADWSPDGTKIVFTGRNRGAYDIFVMEADGSNIMRLTRGMGSNESPTWAPDSRYIVYSSTRGGLYTMLDDGRGQNLIPKSAGCLNADWGPWLAPAEPGEFESSAAQSRQGAPETGEGQGEATGEGGQDEGQKPTIEQQQQERTQESEENPTEKTWENAWD